MRLAKLLCLSLLIVMTHAVAQAPLKIEDLWRRPAYDEPKLSPNAKHLAVLAPVNNRMNLIVIELQSRKGVALTNFKDFDVQNVHWIGNERLVFSLGQRDTPTGSSMQRGGGLFAVSRDGSESRMLAPTFLEMRRLNQFVYRSYAWLRSVPGSDEEFIAIGNQLKADSADVYRMNARTGRATLMTLDRPERVPFLGPTGEVSDVTWVLDRNLVPRVARSQSKDSPTVTVHYRASDKAPWEEIARYDQTKGPAFMPLQFERDNQTLLVATNAGRETMAVFRFDTATKKLGAMVAGHPRFDMGADQLGGLVPGPIFDPKTEEVVGYSVRGDKPEVVWTDDNYARIQKMVDAALPGTVNLFTRNAEAGRMVVAAVSDRQPTRWYLMDEEKKTLEELFASRPWLKPEQLVEMRPFTLKTRDGLELPSYYFLPKDYKPGTRLPTVVHVHGGPHVRAEAWGRIGFGVREAQLMASRGYAVVLPNHRATPGLGSKVFYGGFGAYGREMVQDHIDAAKWAVEQGFADPARICISGASYGGAAVLFALGQAPDVFKCGVAGLVVADTKLELTSTLTDFAHIDASVQFWLRLVGVDSTSQIPEVASPVYLASRIKGRLMMYAGGEDQRTPMEQTRAMQHALERAGNPPKPLIVKDDEGHGYGKLENNVELYTAVLQFLDENIGAGARPKGD